MSGWIGGSTANLFEDITGGYSRQALNEAVKKAGIDDDSVVGDALNDYLRSLGGGAISRLLQKQEDFIEAKLTKGFAVIGALLVTPKIRVPEKARNFLGRIPILVAVVGVANNMLDSAEKKRLKMIEVVSNQLSTQVDTVSASNSVANNLQTGNAKALTLEKEKHKFDVAYRLNAQEDRALELKLKMGALSKADYNKFVMMSGDGKALTYEQMQAMSTSSIAIMSDGSAVGTAQVMAGDMLTYKWRSQLSWGG